MIRLILALTILSHVAFAEEIVNPWNPSKAENALANCRNPDGRFETGCEKEKLCETSHNLKDGKPQGVAVYCAWNSKNNQKVYNQDPRRKILYANEDDLKDRGLSYDLICSVVRLNVYRGKTPCPNSSDLLVWWENEGGAKALCADFENRQGKHSPDAIGYCKKIKSEQKSSVSGSPSGSGAGTR